MLRFTLAIYYNEAVKVALHGTFLALTMNLVTNLKLLFVSRRPSFAIPHIFFSSLPVSDTNGMSVRIRKIGWKGKILLLRRYNKVFDFELCENFKETTNESYANEIQRKVSSFTIS